MEIEQPKRRGRPRKLANADPVSQAPGSEPAGVAETASVAEPAKATGPRTAVAPKAQTKVPEVQAKSSASSVAQSVSSSLPPFLMALSKREDRWMLSCVDAKGNPHIPDHRHHTGKLRDLIRSFNVASSKQAMMIDWLDQAVLGPGAHVSDPDTVLVDHAGACSVLCTDDLRILRLVEQEHRCILAVMTEEGSHTIFPVLVPQDTLAEEAVLENHNPVAVTSGHVMFGDHIVRVGDLGPFWSDWNLLYDRVRNEDLQPFLSLVLSRLPSLEIRYPGYSNRKSRLRTTKAALLFKEIDPYGYLHVRPLSYVEDYPPEFFDNNEIVKAVEIDAEEKTIGVDEVVFPISAAALFQSILDSMGKSAKGSVYEEAGNFILEPAFAKQFLTENLGDLLQQFVLLQSSVLTSYRLRTVGPKLRLSLGSGIDYFEGTADIEIDGQRFAFGRFMAEYRKQGFVVLSDGSRAYPEAKDLQRYERLLSKVGKDDRSVSVSLFDLALVERMESIEVEGEGWKRADAFFSGYNSIPARPSSTIHSGELRAYQQYGVKWLGYLQEHNFGCCLADEMGLGKTVQVIAVLRDYHASHPGAPPSLVLMPRSLLFNWLSELQRFAPDLPVHMHYGADRDVARVSALSDCVVLSSYATVRIDVQFFSKGSFSYLVLDESQNIKNLETKTTGAVLSIEARHRIALSGTPVENSLADLYSLFRFLNPSFFGTMAEFARTFFKPIQEKHDQDALKDLRSRVYPFMLRRIKKDVLADLPPKTEQVAYIELDEQHMALYHRRRQELKDRIAGIVSRDGVAKNSLIILQALTELRRLAGVPEADGEFLGVSAKREYVKEMVANVVADGHKCLVFTNFLATVDLVSEDLSSMGVGNLVMTGATVDRQGLVRRFQSDPSIGAFIMTLKTGGLGLNLTAADYVFIFDPWWNQAAEAQAIDRTHRIGQVNPVFCYRMIAKGTIEEKILELQQAKTGLVSSLITADANAMKSLTEEDISRLLG